jgi:hypothetical protein
VVSLKGKSLKSLIFLLIGSSIHVWIALAPIQQVAAQDEPGRKVGGIMGNPAQKRGIEMGFDMGFIAGKADKENGLKPDPKRHDAFNDPEKYYRYEFGSRAAFISGFRGGFAGGYQKAFGKEIRVTSPGYDTGNGKAMEAVPAKTAKPRGPDPASDAL